MADLSKTIEIIFAGVDNVSPVLKTVGSGLGDISGGITNIAAPFNEATIAIGKFEAALGAFVAAGLVVAFNASKDFESSVIELQKVLGNTETTEEAEAKAIELSDAYGQSASKILESMANFKQSGFDLNSAMDLAKNSMDLVIAGGLDANEASNLLVATLKGFNAEAEDATRLIDILNETSNNYATDVEQLADGMARVSPIASQMGFSMEETAGLLTPIIEVFRSGDEAANALRTGLLKLTDDSKPVQDALAALGVSQTDANGALKSGKELFYEVAKAMEGMDNAQRSFLVQQLVGIEQAPKMSLLFSDLGKVTEITATAMGAAGSAAKEVAVKLDSSQVAVDRFKAAFTNLSKEVGDSFRDSAKGAINGATDIENAIRNLVDAGTFDSVLNYISSFANEIGTALQNIAKNLPEAMKNVKFDSLLDGLDTLKGAFGGMFDGIDISTPEGLSKVIQTVIDALGGLQNTAAGIVKFLTPITDAAGSMITIFGDLSPATQELIGKVFALGTAATGLAAVLATGGAMMAGISALGVALMGPAGIVIALGAVVSGAIAASGALGSWLSHNLTDDLDAQTAALKKQNDQVEKFYDKIKELPEKYQLEIYAAVDSGQFDKAQVMINKAVADEHAIKIQTQVEQKEFEDFYKKIQGLGNLSKSEIEILAKVTGKEDAEKAIQQIIKDRELALKAKAEMEGATETIKVWTEKHGTMEMKVPVDTSKIKEAQKEIDKVPTEKQIEIKLQGDIDKELATIKANAETVQTAMEWKAKIDIAEVEAATKQVESAFNSINTSIESTGDVISASLEASESENMQTRWAALEALEKEADYREQSMQLQKELTEAQIKYMEARTEALNNGDFAIKITSDGLEPALEMVMWEVVKKVQLRANEESADFLLGIK